MTTATLDPATTAPAAVQADPRIGLRAHLRHIGALVRRNLLQVRADPESMFDALLMPIIFTLLFVYVFGGEVSGSQKAYVNYLVPGLMATTCLNIATTVGSGINSDFKTGVMDRFRTLPIARSSVLIAKVIVEAMRMIVATTILLGLGFALGLRVHTDVMHFLAAVALALVFGAALTWTSILLGLVVNSSQAVQGIGMLVLMPLQFGSSIFAQPDTMPGWLRAFTKVNPVSNLADAGRALIDGGSYAHAVWITLAWAAGITVVFAPLAVARFRSKT
jgi:oleandomycin transport system permease protein